LETQEHFDNTRLLFVPLADYMSEAMQKKLLDLISKGMIIVFIGSAPRYNMQFKPTRILGRGLGIDSKPFHVPTEIQVEGNSFKSIAYSYLSSKGSTKPLAKAGNKVMGAFKKLGKGKFYFFGYDISAKGEPSKLILIKNLLLENGITTPIACSDPAVDIMIHTNDSGAAVYVINTDTNQPVGTIRKVVIAIDLAKTGFRQAKIELTDILGEKNVSTTSQILKEGLIFELGRLDARVYWIPKK